MELLTILGGKWNFDLTQKIYHEDLKILPISRFYKIHSRRPGELVRDGGGDEANTIEQTGAGTFRETWVQEETGFKIVLTLDHFGDRVTMVQPGFTHKVFDVTQALLRRAVTLWRHTIFVTLWC